MRAKPQARLCRTRQDKIDEATVSANRGFTFLFKPERLCCGSLSVAVTVCAERIVRVAACGRFRLYGRGIALILNEGCLYFKFIDVVIAVYSANRKRKRIAHGRFIDKVRKIVCAVKVLAVDLGN